ncbi:hypothetical protein IC235_04485 [Hymenobacter sp. BT664]|uniref:Outer membrane protein beta-barrel domain-containing protein n=1 Tax=Hymenobacter montanus TaxID=2771359 RepID=A0A927BAH4_9BACT|nr:hypothetical protein [Hymenobacter montanus]MBD2767152.1 hypothetical protein [Hymenobacter montanus]
MCFRALIFGAGLFTTAVVAIQPAQAQHRNQLRHYNSQGRPYYRGSLHLTLGGGTTFYNGDLGNNPGDNFLGPAVSLGVLYRLTTHLHIGSEFSYFEMGARDKAPDRGLAFVSQNGLGTVFFRFDLLPDESIYAASAAEPPRLQVFVQGGAGLLLYSPKSYFGKEPATPNTSFLEPERNDYPALAGAVPVGGGFNIRFSNQLRAGLEANYYLTTTDQLDDINVRLGGASLGNDGFVTAILKLDYSLK